MAVSLIALLILLLITANFIIVIKELLGIQITLPSGGWHFFSITFDQALLLLKTVEFLLLT